MPNTSRPLKTQEPAPSDYGALFEKYIGFVKTLVIARGIRPSDAEDAASEILIKFIEKDALSWYDPTKIHHKAVDGTVVNRTASFKTLLRRFVSLYSLQCRDRQASRDHREATRLDATATPDLLIELAHTKPFDTADTIAASLSARVLLKEARGYLTATPWTDPTTGTVKSLATVWDAAILTYDSEGVIDPKILADWLCISPTKAKALLRQMRHRLAEVFPGPVLAYLA